MLAYRLILALVSDYPTTPKTPAPTPTANPVKAHFHPAVAANERADESGNCCNVPPSAVAVAGRVKGMEEVNVYITSEKDHTGQLVLTSQIIGLAQKDLTLTTTTCPPAGSVEVVSSVMVTTTTPPVSCV